MKVDHRGSKREGCVSGADRKLAQEAVLSSSDVNVTVERLGCSIIQSAGGAMNSK